MSFFGLVARKVFKNVLNIAATLLLFVGAFSLYEYRPSTLAASFMVKDNNENAISAAFLYPEQSFDFVMTDLTDRHNASATQLWTGAYGQASMARFLMLNFRGQAPLCDRFFAQNEDPKLPNITLIKFDMNCAVNFRKVSAGTGNLMWAFIAARLQARILGVDIVLQCSDGWNSRQLLPTPWIMGYFPKQDNTNLDLTIADVCVSLASVPIRRILPEFQYELRRMALALVGLPQKHHTIYPVAKDFFDGYFKQRKAPYQNVLQLHNESQLLASIPENSSTLSVQFDEVAIHFRCGDMIMSKHKTMGLLSFLYFSNNIDPTAKSIGIITNPWNKSSVNRDETYANERCQFLVYGLMEYLRQRFPAARIRVHNDADETLAIVYSRFIMASQAFAAISTFSAFPVAATFGKGYFYADAVKEQLSNMWAALPAVASDNIQLVSVPFLKTTAIFDNWDSGEGNGASILAWLTNDSVTTDWLD